MIFVPGGGDFSRQDALAIQVRQVARASEPVAHSPIQLNQLFGRGLRIGMAAAQRPEQFGKSRLQIPRSQRAVDVFGENAGYIHVQMAEIERARRARRHEEQTDQNGRRQ